MKKQKISDVKRKLVSLYRMYNGSDNAHERMSAYNAMVKLCEKHSLDIHGHVDKPTVKKIPKPK